MAIDAQTLKAALVGYQHEHEVILQKIAEIQRELGGTAAAGAAVARSSSASGKRVMSAAARRRISAAQRKRWAAFHNTEGKPAKRAAGKRRLSPEGRARIAEAARKRWAEARAAKAQTA